MHATDGPAGSALGVLTLCEPVFFRWILSRRLIVTVIGVASAVSSSFLGVHDYLTLDLTVAIQCCSHTASFGKSEHFVCIAELNPCLVFVNTHGCL